MSAGALPGTLPAVPEHINSVGIKANGVVALLYGKFLPYQTADLLKNK
jgi:hypothetical protein